MTVHAETTTSQAELTIREAISDRLALLSARPPTWSCRGSGSARASPRLHRTSGESGTCASAGNAGNGLFYVVAERWQAGNEAGWF